jgi:glycosyltransferase involved in cell wall biosynthesis
MPETRAAIERLGIGSRVRMLGAREDAAELVGGGDVLLLPSSTEGLPGVVLEAAAREVPAIAWDVGGVGEVIEDSRTGYVVPPGDGKAFIGRVLELIDDPERARGMGEAARAWVCAEFDLPRVAGAFERLYQDHAR